ncbi:MAG: hypothetical protein ACT4N2_00655 [Hyphomicrobium sp.]
MSILQADWVEDIIRRGSVKDSDVQRLKSAFYENGDISAEEADALFAINDAARVQDPAWADVFVGAITDYIVESAVPYGYLTAENAEWLISRISRDGRVDSKTELDLLINVLDKARWSPASLVSFALQQVKHAVISGDGPLRSGVSLEPGAISEGEVELLRRILYAFGGDDNIAVTRAEAEILFEINDATDGQPPNAAWTDLFVKAIANVLMSASGYAVPSREQALRSEAWLDSRGDLAPMAMLGAMVTSSLSSVLGAYREQSSEERALARLERQRIEIITNEAITEGEASWLADHIGRDGRLTANEQALLDYLKRESPEIHPSLVDLVARRAEAA